MTKYKGNLPKLLTAKEAAEYLKVPVETLRDWRKKGKGPAYKQFGENSGVRYLETDLADWLKIELSQ